MSYDRALTDWLACAARGAQEPAARAARSAGSGLLERVAAAATAGHVLDFDDTYEPGLAHLSAPTAPASLCVAAAEGATIADALEAYEVGFESMGAISAASHPALYERGLHPTAVCGSVGAAMAAAQVLDLGEEERESAAALALTAAGGMRAAFGSAGKAVQVGLAAAQGVHAALQARGGARMDLASHQAATGFEGVFGGRLPERPGRPAIEENWIKAWPCCLQTHGAIEAALAAGEPPKTIRVHPLSVMAAPVGVPADGLQAKFSIPYLAAFAHLHGEPGVESFAEVDAASAALAAEIEVVTDESLAPSAAIVNETRVEAARGAPSAPLSDLELLAKVQSLCGGRLDGVLDDGTRPATDLLSAAGL